jgi:hypothetical protein
VSAPADAAETAAPRRAEVRRAFAIAAWRLPLLFAVVFYGTDHLSAWRAVRWHLHAGWELAIPFWPPAYAVYLSVFALPFLPLFLLPDAPSVRRWERAMAASVVLAGLVFIALPAEPGYATPPPAGAWQPLAALVRLIAGQHNLLPSLHVALSLVTLLALWPWVGAWPRALLAAWLVLLVASVLLTHQHHVADVLAGALLGALASRWAGHRPAGRAAD